jgi:translation elongation factor EF-1alpha
MGEVIRMPEQEIGTIEHYYDHISVGIIKLIDGLKVGEQIHIKGRSSDFSQIVSSMQIEHVNVTEAKVGDAIGIKIEQKVRPGDKVYKVT